MGKRQKIILCDTNIFIHVQNGTEHIVQEFGYIGNQNIAITPIIIAELYRGCDNKTDVRNIRLAARKHHMYHFDINTSQVFVNLMQTYVLSHRIAIPDAMIAASAITNSLELYTLNRDDFKFIPNVKLYKPRTY